MTGAIRLPARRGAAAAACVATLFALAAPAAAAPAAGARQPPRTVSVTGYASREVTPDVAVISVGVATRGATPAETLAANAAAATKVIEAVRKAGVEARDVRTDNVSITPNYRNVRDSAGDIESREDGFTASSSVTVRVRDLAKLGPLVAAATGQGANRINGLTFEYSGRRQAEAELQAEAVRNARETASRLVEAAGARLGPLQAISAGDVRPMPRRGDVYAMRAAPADMAAPPVEAGEITLSASVNATWIIE